MFLKTCKEIGYDGLLSAEQCSPIITHGHEIGGLDEVDKRYQDSLNYFRSALKGLDYYGGHK